jgi:hypothetical protein
MSLISQLTKLTTATLTLLLFNCLFINFAQAGTMYRISQESAPGLGDFDDNILGFIDPFRTSQTAFSYYRYFGGSFNGFRPTLQSNISHLFLLDAADGLSLLTVHDKPRDLGGGFASMRFDLENDTADIRFVDEPADFSRSTGSQFNFSWGWGSCCTDGAIIGSLDNDWTVFSQFNQLGVVEGGRLRGWKAFSAQGTSVNLNLAIGKRVRIDRESVPEPEVDVQEPEVDVQESASVFSLLTVSMISLLLAHRSD